MLRRPDRRLSAKLGSEGRCQAAVAALIHDHLCRVAVSSAAPAGWAVWAVYHYLPLRRQERRPASRPRRSYCHYRGPSRPWGSTTVLRRLDRISLPGWATWAAAQPPSPPRPIPLRCVAESNAALSGSGRLGRVGRFPLLYAASNGATSRVRTSAVRLSLPWTEPSRGQQCRRTTALRRLDPVDHRLSARLGHVAASTYTSALPR